MTQRLGSWSIETQLISETPADVIRVTQVHGGDILWARHAAWQERGADGIAAPIGFTRPFLIRTADCLPLVVATDKLVCALHVSRKTLIHGLLDQVPQFLAPADITGVYIGPHVCADHFVFPTVGPDIAVFQAKWPKACRAAEDGLHLSLQTVVEQYLEEWKVGPNVRVVDSRCAFETPSLPSYRRSLKEGAPLIDHVATVVRMV